MYLNRPLPDLPIKQSPISPFSFPRVGRKLGAEVGILATGIYVGLAGLTALVMAIITGVPFLMGIMPALVYGLVAWVILAIPTTLLIAFIGWLGGHYFQNRLTPISTHSLYIGCTLITLAALLFPPAALLQAPALVLLLNYWVLWALPWLCGMSGVAWLLQRLNQEVGMETPVA